MDILELGAIGELVGGFAVIVTLVYFSAQLRQNTRALVSSVGVAGSGQAIAVYLPLAQDADLAELLGRGARDYEGLPETDKFRFSSFWRGALITHQGFFVQHQDGFLPPDLWGSYTRQIDAAACTPGFRSWWQEARGVFDGPFQVYIEAKMEEGTPVRSANGGA